MEDRDKEKEQGFRVVDKRRFNTESDKNDNTFSETSEKSADKEKQEIKTDSSKNVDSSNTVSSSEEQSVDAYTNGQIPPQEINFAAFLMGLYTQTLIYLGDIPNPETNQVSANLEAGKQNIAVLDIIEEKTKGNLTPEEEHLFKEIMTTLRLQYVKKTKNN